MPYVSVFVDSEDIAEDLSTDEIARLLVGRQGWKEAIQRVCSEKQIPGSIPEDELFYLLRDFYFGFPITDQLQRLCHERLHVFKPVTN